MKLFTLCLILLFSLSPVWGKRIYVKQTATGTNTGTSWTNAYTTIPQGFANSVVGDEVWIASGTYKPALASSTFLVPSGVKVYGSFAGTENNLSERNISSNLTILSGDVGATGVASDNCEHVVVMANLSSATIFDGFKIISGYSYVIGGGITEGGGAIRITNSSPTIANCIFLENYSYMRGGAIYQQDGGNVTILNCEFGNNSTGNDVNSMGGAVFFNSGTLTMKDCQFYSNSSIRGGALATMSTTVTIDRSSFSGNFTNSQQGGAMYIGDLSSYKVYNSLFVGNVAKTTGAVAYYSSTFNEKSHTFTNCTFASNKNLTSNSATMHANKYTRFFNCIFWDNIANEEIYSAILVDKPIVNYCIVDGDLNFGINVYPDSAKFVNPGIAANAPFTLNGLNYSLQESSYAVNNGRNSDVNSSYNLDIDSTTRIRNTYVDIGAYETNYTTNLAYTITLISNPINAGTLTGAGTFTRPIGFREIVATAKPGYRFLYWTQGNDTVSDYSSYSVLPFHNETFTAHFALLTSIKKNITNHIISSLYPNPSQGLLNVAISSKIKSNLKVRVYNILGNLVDDHSIIDNIGIYNYTINTSAYSKGIYLMYLYDNDNNEMATEKFIVQ